MTCKQCKYIATCMAEVDSLGQVFDPNYDGEHRCTDFVPFTNADRIRAMSDEDMAKWIDWLFGRCEWCDTDKIATDDCKDVECAPCILKWLKQPFEGE